MKVHEYAAGDSARHLARLYKALAHPVRLLLLHALLQEEACVCHLTTLLHKPQPYISQQLSILREAGLLTDRREGQVVYYRVSAPMITEMLALGQRIVQSKGMTGDLLPLPRGPLPTCPCPKCQAQTEACCTAKP